MRKEIFVRLSAVALAAFAVGCSDATNTNTANTNANMMANGNMTANVNMTNTGAMPANMMEPRAASDESEITTVNEGGEVREVRRFRNPNSRVERVEVTTRGGRRTARVYYRDETVRDLPENRVEEALSATGNALADAGGYVADKTKQGLNATGEAAGEVRDATGKVISTAADKTKDVGSKVGSKAVEVGREGGSIVVDGAKEVGKGVKKVGEGAAKGAKKTGSAIKDAVTP